MQGGTVTFKFNDDGSISLIEKKAKKAGKAMNDLGNASQATDRRIKGVTQQSSNASKNFSKQAQTMQGGIVAVYATIAAQVFAVSAAFQFLKDAMETRNLIQSQETFGAVTGVAYRTLTKDIQAATGGMLQFKEAAQAAAIGTASGLTAGQLEDLGKAAKNASFALGRDLTDSFNRLVRGVTKAEPELLDELGIILRLEPAMKAYAVQIGKNVKDLTLFEKSQAVANEVLEQAESKFGAIQKTLDPSAFALAQFGKSFDDLMKVVKEGVGNFAAVILPFFSENVGALVGAMSLFLIPILKSILPDFNAMGAAAKANFAIVAGAADDAAAAAHRAKLALDQSKGMDVQGGLKSSGSEFMKENKIKQVGGVDDGMLSKKQLEVRLRNFKKGKGDQSKAYKEFLGDQEILHAASLGKMQQNEVKWGKWWESKKANQAARHAKWEMYKVKISQKAARMMAGAMRLMGWASMLLMIGSAVIELWKWVKGVDEAAEAEKKMLDKGKKRYKELTEDVANMNKLQAQGILNLTELVQHQGKKMASADIQKTLENFNQYLTAKPSEDRTKALTNQVKLIRELGNATGRAEFETLATEMEERIKSGEAMTINLKKEEGVTKNAGEAAIWLAEKYRSAAASAGKWTQTMGALNSALRQQMGTAGSIPMMNLATAYQGALREGEAIQFGREAAADDEGALSMKKFAEADALDEKIRLKEKSNKDNMGPRAGERDFAYAARLEAQSKGLQDLKDKQTKLREEAEKHVKNQIKYTQESIKTGKELDAIKASEDEINQLQKDSLASLKTKMAAQKALAGLSLIDTTAKNKNAQLDQQQIIFADKLEQSKHAATTAAINLAIATKKGNEEEIESATTAKEIADEQLLIDTALVAQKKEQTDFQKLANTHAQETFELERKTKANADNRRVQQRKHEDDMLLANSKAEEDALKLLLIGQQQAEVDDMKLKIALKTQQNQEYADKKNADPNKIKTNAEELLKLVNDKLLAEQKITMEYAKQNGLLKIAAENRAQEIKQKKITNMTRGGSFGWGNITPQAVELNRLLAEHNLTIEEASRKDAITGERKLDTLIKQADAAAKMGIEMELAQKTSDIMKSGFDSLFQALLDGTQSFGDAMKGVMKQVLADLAAAYMSAAAMTALRSMGLPGLPARYGGIMSASGKSFAYGGVSDGPESGYAATLHGTEAVVPLGNDKSIPVKMLGGQGGNTVNVSINMEGGQSNTSVEGDQQMQGLGRAIGGLVQQHLQTEMRPGGLLNQQGTKGRGG